ncbi:hypothetical protein Tco_0720637 [Tanacetum coccineum]
MDRPVTKDLKTMLDRQNPLVKQFRMASLKLAMGQQKVKIILIGARLTDGRQYNLPTANEVAVLIVGDFDSMSSEIDIIVHENSDGYTMVEAERMLYIRNQQCELRCETYSRLAKAAESGENKKRGSKVVLPSSFTGSPRYMMQNYLDVIAMCKWYGYPDLFITFTCNPKRPEITRFLKKKGLKSEDRPYVTTRVFKMKLDQLVKDIKERRIFSKVKADIEDKLRFPVDIDRCISAEIPDKNEDLELH